MKRIICKLGLLCAVVALTPRQLPATESHVPCANVEPVISFAAAKPVWPEGREREWNCQVGFTAEFDGKAAKDAVLRFTGATMCRVFLNGEFFGYGPARAAHGFVRVEELPLAGKLKGGRNVIAIEVAGYCCDSFYTVRQPSFLQAEVVAGDGKVIAATGANGGGFKAQVLPHRVKKVQRFSFQRPFSEAYEMDLHSDGWRMGIGEQGTGNGECKLAVQPQLPLLPRIVPVPEYRIFEAKGVLHSGTAEIDEALPVETPRPMTCTVGKKWRRDGWPVSELEWIPYYDFQRMKYVKDGDCPKCGCYALHDFGALYAGFPGLTVECVTPCTVYLAFDEVLGTDGDFNLKRFKSCCNVVAWRLKEAGMYHLESFEPYAFRYAKTIVLDGRAKISGLHIREYANPEAGKAKFSSSDPALDKVFEAARLTYAENAVDGFMDCPCRERAGWNCDGFFTARASVDFTGNAAEEKIFLENYLLPETFDDIMDGMLPQCYPADHPDHAIIPNWAMWYVLELEEYFKRTGDREMVEKARPKVMKLLALFDRYRNSDGLLEKLPRTVFVEWSRSNALVNDVSYPTNMLWARVLDAVANLYGADDRRKEADSIRETVRRQSFDGTFFVDRAIRQKDGTLKPDTEATETCQYYAFFFDVATPESHPELWKRLVEDFGPRRKTHNKWPKVAFSNAFIGNYLRFECLAKAGLSAQILDEAKGYFLYMADRTGTLWEHDAPSASCCHGFASHIAHVLYRDVLGIKEIDRVNKRIALCFRDVPLEHCEGEIPVDGGFVKVSWKRIDGKMVPAYSAPQGWTVETEGTCAFPAGNGRQVGLFYFLWLGEHGRKGPYDVTKILAEHPDAGKNPEAPYWGPWGAYHHWGEPLYGYYFSDDEWVVRRHMKLIMQAGIDFLFFDTTNGPIYDKNAKLVMRVLQEYHDAGWKVPGVMFYTNTASGRTVRRIYDAIYKGGFAKDIWYRLDGKPVIVAKEEECDDETKAFFTIVKSQWPNEPSKKGGWPWMDFTRPQRLFAGEKVSKSVMNVSVAQHPTCRFGDSVMYGEKGNRGRAFHDGANDPAPDAWKKGFNFQEQWDRAHEVKPDIVLVTGWNEWIAGRWRRKDNPDRPVMFVDCANAEYSRDIEMMRGGYGDAYFVQLRDNVRKFKGMPSEDAAGNPPGKWKRYRCFADNAMQRDWPGYSTNYVNRTQRNAPKWIEVSHDERNVYFKVKTQKPLSGRPGEGDFMRIAANGRDANALGDVKFLEDGMELCVPRKALGLDKPPFRMKFKFVDSTEKCQSVLDYYDHGVVEPLGREEFVYRANL